MDKDISTIITQGVERDGDTKDTRDPEPLMYSSRGPLHSTYHYPSSLSQVADYFFGNQQRSKRQKWAIRKFHSYSSILVCLIFLRELILFLLDSEGWLGRGARKNLQRFFFFAFSKGSFISCVRAFFRNSPVSSSDDALKKVIIYSDPCLVVLAICITQQPSLSLTTFTIISRDCVLAQIIKISFNADWNSFLSFSVFPFLYILFIITLLRPITE